MILKFVTKILKNVANLLKMIYTMQCETNHKICGLDGKYVWI